MTQCNICGANLELWKEMMHEDHHCFGVCQVDETITATQEEWNEMLARELVTTIEREVELETEKLEALK